MFTSSNCTHPNLLMCIWIGALLAPKHQSYLQGAGRAGDGIIHELVSLRRIPWFVDIMGVMGEGWDQDEDIDIPTRTAPAVPSPTQPPLIKHPKPVFVFSHAAMTKLGKASPPAWESVYWPRIRYEWPNDDNEDCETPPPLHILRYSTAAHIELVGFESVTTISDFFLAHCQHPTSISIDTLCNVTSVGYSFMAGCRDLQSIDLSPLRSVTTIGHYFLNGCCSLTTLNLSPLTALQTVGSSFLQGCSSLTQLNISALHRLSSIQNSFLMECRGLTSLDLSPLLNTTFIGDCFLVSCVGLISLDLAPLANVTSVGLFFMATCTGISDLDISPLVHISHTRKQEVLTFPINNYISRW